MVVKNVCTCTYSKYGGPCFAQALADGHLVSFDARAVKTKPRLGNREAVDGHLHCCLERILLGCWQCPWPEIEVVLPEQELSAQTAKCRSQSESSSHISLVAAIEKQLSSYSSRESACLSQVLVSKACNYSGLIQPSWLVETHYIPSQLRYNLSAMHAVTAYHIGTNKLYWI